MSRDTLEAVGLAACCVLFAIGVGIFGAAFLLNLMEALR